jgi:hypothetical protein
MSLSAPLSALKKFATRSREPDDMARTFARCFKTLDGQAVLDQLHAQTLFRVIDPHTDDRNLRFLEGQRQLTLWICQMIAKGQHN